MSIALVMKVGAVITLKIINFTFVVKVLVFMMQFLNGFCILEGSIKMVGINLIVSSSLITKTICRVENGKRGI